MKEKKHNHYSGGNRMNLLLEIMCGDFVPTKIIYATFLCGLVEDSDLD